MPNGQPAQLANLKEPWTSSGNPNGRPKGSKSITEMLKALQGKSIEQLWDTFKDKRDNTRVAAARILLVHAGEMDGTRNSDILSAFSEVADRTEGKPKQVTELTHNMGETRPVVLDQAKLEQAEQEALERKGGAQLPASVPDGESTTVDDAVTHTKQPSNSE